MERCKTVVGCDRVGHPIGRNSRTPSGKITRSVVTADELVAIAADDD